MATALCRLRSAELTTPFVDLGMSPPCETYLGADELPSTSTSAKTPTHAVASGSACSRSPAA